MDRKIIFIAGVYGVGKTTLCNALSKKYGILSFSASDLISEKNNEVYGSNKYVSDSDKNQEILINQVNKIDANTFILNGHFCLKEKNNKIILLEDEIFKRLHLSMILLLSAKTDIISKNLFLRDNFYYDIQYINDLMYNEEKQANKISTKYHIPLQKYDMKFDDQDVDRVIELINKNWEAEK